MPPQSWVCDGDADNLPWTLLDNLISSRKLSRHSRHYRPIVSELATQKPATRHTVSHSSIAAGIAPTRCLPIKYGGLGIEQVRVRGHVLPSWHQLRAFSVPHSRIYPHISITHTHPFNGPLSPTGLPRWVGTRKVKPIWILLKQETVSGNGISWAVCKSASRSRQITTAPHHSVFYRPDALPATQPTASKHWRVY